MAGSFVVDVTAAGFQKDVVEKSMTTPVLLDFWAAWCGPCRTLGPVLEKLAAEFAGGFVLGKVDTEREQDLAYAFGVQGIPFCVLVDGGRPLDAFQGALPEAEVRRFLQRHGIEPLVLEPVPAAPPPPVAVDPTSPAGRLATALAAVRRGDVAGVRGALDKFPEEDERADQAQRLLAGLDWFTAALRGEVPAEAQLASARSAFLAGDAETAMAALLASVAADKGCLGGLARKAMLLCFVVVGEDDERLDAVRRRLATLLY